MVNMKAFSGPEKLLRLSRNGPQVTFLVRETRKFVGLTPYHAFNIDYANLQLQKYDSLWCILSVQSSCQMEGRHRANSPIYTWTSCNHPYRSLSLAPFETSSVWLVIDNFVSSCEEGRDLSNHAQMSMIQPNRPENNVRLLSLRAGSRGFPPDYEHNPWLKGKWYQKNSLGVHFITY